MNSRPLILVLTRLGLCLMLRCGYDFTNPIDPAAEAPQPPHIAGFELTAIDSLGIHFSIHYSFGNSSKLMVERNGKLIDSLTSGELFIDTAQLQPNTTYRYRLFATNSHGRSIYSSDVLATTPPSQNNLGEIQSCVRLHQLSAPPPIRIRIVALNDFIEPREMVSGENGCAHSGYTLKPGRYAVTASRFGFASASDTVEVTARQRTLTRPLDLLDTLAPVVDAGKDTTVSLGDSIVLSPTATDSFFALASRSWLCRESADCRGGRADTTLSFADSGSYTLWYSATDINGNSATDSVTITVIADKPKAQAGADTLCTPGENICLSGAHSSDKFGQIVRYDWRIDGGEWLNRGTDATVCMSVNDSLPHQGLLRVHDDDMQQDIDTIFINRARFWKSFDGFNHSPSVEAVAALSNKLVMLRYDGGGTDISVHTSLDGKEWTASFVPETNSPFKRNNAKLCGFKGAVWMIGGERFGEYLNDVWKTEDGAHWEQLLASAPFAPRIQHSLTVHRDTLWLAGGQSGGDESALDDIWCSTDGVSWRQKSKHALPTKTRMGTFLGCNGYLYIYARPYSRFDYSQLWRSVDGANWAMVADSAPFYPRTSSAVCSFRNKLWIVGGTTDTATYSDIWSSSDGIAWNKLTDYCGTEQRISTHLTSFDDKLWFFGGYARGESNVNASAVFFMSPP